MIPLLFANPGERSYRKYFYLIKPNRVRKLSKYFGDNLNFSLTTSTKKNGSGATLGTLGDEKLKFTKKTLTAKI